MIAFGPIPSRRLGRSLGVNHIPHKVCTYSCIYCQVGPTMQMRVDRRRLLSTAEIVAEVTRKIDACRAAGEAIDYLSFVPDGEPTLDRELGAHIRALAGTGIPVAVITNSSLLWMPEVRSDLSRAHLVSIKVDTTQDATWRRIDRPQGGLDLPTVLDGVRAFARDYTGTLISETMLVRDVNDDEANIEGVAEFLRDVKPACAYIGVPTRPPACDDATPPDATALVRAHEILQTRLPRVELLAAHEDGTFALTGDPADDLLAILAVHPMRESAVRAYLAKSEDADWSLVERLSRDGRIDRVAYRGDDFFIRRDRAEDRARREKRA